MEDHIIFLKNLGFSEHLIRRIVADNPTYLDRSITDVRKLISKLIDLGMTDIVDLIDANPYILNLDVYKIDKYIDKKQKTGLPLRDIVDDLESQPALFLDIGGLA